MSIYVAINCLGVDSELIKTVKDCLIKAKTSEDVHIHVACAGNRVFYNFVKHHLKDYTNVKFSYFELESSLGVGVGRAQAAAEYDNEDYYLQIDSHSRFDQHWDDQLIAKLKNAIQITNNQKTILSAHPSKYGYRQTSTNIEEYKEDNPIKYNHWWHNDFWIPNFPRWRDLEVEAITDLNIKTMIEETGFAPISKINAYFIFGNKHFASNRCLDEKILFWEEEFVQSIELVANGFTLVFPHMGQIICHLYTDQSLGEYGVREKATALIEQTGMNLEDYQNNITAYYLTYLNNLNNKTKIAEWENYAQVDAKHGIEDRTGYPKDYVNLGYLPI
jgi:hypothetical protein